VRTAITNATRARPEPGRTAGAEAGGDAAIVDPKSFVAGFVLATHDLREPIVEIGPVGVLVEDQPHFPGPPPMLHLSLPLPCRAHVIVIFCKYEPR
jgi:hypothetical protein